MSQLTVTILTPTLNAAPFLPRCLHSLQTQRLSSGKLQHLILDGGSSDNTVSLARRLSPKTRIVEHVEGNLYRAMNQGLDLVEGQLVGWLNADDWYFPNAIESVIAAYRSCQETDLVLGDVAFVKNETIASWRKHHADLFDRLRRGERLDIWVPPLALFWRRDTLQRIGKYDESYAIASDYDFWLRAAASERPLQLLHCGATIGAFRIHPGSLSAGRGQMLARAELCSLLALWLTRANIPPYIRDYVRWRYRVVRCAQFYLHDDKNTGRRWFRRWTYLLRDLRWSGPGWIKDGAVELLKFAVTRTFQTNAVYSICTGNRKIRGRITKRFSEDP